MLTRLHAGPDSGMKGVPRAAATNHARSALPSSDCMQTRLYGASVLRRGRGVRGRRRRDGPERRVYIRHQLRDAALAIALMLRRDLAVAPDQKEVRQGIDPIAPGDRPVAVLDQRDIHGTKDLYERPVGLIGDLKRHGVNDQSVLAHSALQPVENRNLAATRRTPRGPESQHDDLAGLLAQVDARVSHRIPGPEVRRGITYGRPALIARTSREG